MTQFTLLNEPSNEGRYIKGRISFDLDEMRSQNEQPHKGMCTRLILMQVSCLTQMHCAD